MGREAGFWDGLLAGLAVLAALVLLDIVLGPRGNFAGALVVAPVLAAALSNPRGVALVAAPTIAASVLVGWHDHAGSVPTLVRSFVVVLGSAIALWVSHRRRVVRRRLGQVTHIAEVAQTAILDPLPDQVGPARFAGWYLSATEDALVGGDFYQVVGYKDRARWIIGDVKGKGVDAVRVAAAAIGAFREAGEVADTLGEVLARVDHRVGQYLDDEGSATAILAELAPGGILTMLNCGHPSPLALHDGPPVALIPPKTTTPLGLAPAPVEQESVLRPGQSLWFFTDGIIEARTRDGTRGLDLSRLALGLGERGVQAAAVILERTRRAAGQELGDDSAGLVVQYCGP